MTVEQFHALELWVHAQAKLIAAGIAGHHPNTLAKHVQRYDDRRREAFILLVKDG